MRTRGWLCEEFSLTAMPAVRESFLQARVGVGAPILPLFSYTHASSISLGSPGYCVDSHGSHVFHSVSSSVWGKETASLTEETKQEKEMLVTVLAGHRPQSVLLQL